MTKNRTHRHGKSKKSIEKNGHNRNAFTSSVVISRESDNEENRENRNEIDNRLESRNSTNVDNSSKEPSSDGADFVASNNQENNDRNKNHACELLFYPFAYALHDGYLQERCWYCLGIAAVFKRCTGCHRAIFCDEKCQQLAWKDHRDECKGMKKCGHISTIEVRLLGRIVTRYKAIKLGKDKTIRDFYTDRSSKRTIMEVWSHVEHMKTDVLAMKKFNDIHKELLRFYGSKALLDKEEIFELHCRDFINRHAISDTDYIDEIGKGLYLDLCSYDHSCRPNAIWMCRGFVALLRSISSETNLTDRSTTFYSYIDLLNGLQVRRKLLKDTWYFDCHCSRCDDPDDAMLTSILCPHCKDKRERLITFGSAPYKDPVTQIITCPKCHLEVSREYVFEAIEAMRFIDRVIEKRETEQMSRKNALNLLTDMKERYSQILPEINVYYCKLIRLLMDFIDLDDAESLLFLHQQTEECVRYCYAYNHPAVAVHYQSIAKFYLRCKQPHRGLLYAKKAKEIVEYTFGDEHVLTQDINKLLQEAQRQVDEARNLILGMRKSEAEKDRGTGAVNDLKNDQCTYKTNNEQSSTIQHDTEPNMKKES